MNILPKKSWHVRTRRNIERVHRDEAEAELLERNKRERHLEAEQEARIRELRIRAGIPIGESKGKDDKKHEHFDLFKHFEEHRQSTNAKHEDEAKGEEEINQKRIGFRNRLVRSNDVGRPWYCSREPMTSEPSTSELITSMYDPMTAIKHAEEIVRCRRRTELRETPTSKVEKNHDCESSPEIVMEIKADASRRAINEKKKKKKKKKHTKEHNKKHQKNL